MLTCLPQSICSWNYRVLGTAGSDAAVTFNALSDAGTISLGPETFAVRKQSLLANCWTLNRDEAMLAEGERTSVISRTMEIRAGSLVVLVKPRSILTRAVDIMVDDRTVGSIETMHPFTRRATIQCNSEISELNQLFAFWLTAMLWRRAGSS